MSETFNLYQAKTHLSELVDRAEKGEEIVIAKAGRPVARLVPLAGTRQGRVPGGAEGAVWIAEDFDAPLPAEVLAVFTEDAPPERGPEP